jgi:predicted ATPase
LERVIVGFADRERELGLLQSAFSDAVTQKKGRVFFLSGEAGIGKSRLVQEFMKRIEPSATSALLVTDAIL